MPRTEAQRRADAAYRKKNAAKIAAAEKIIAAHVPRETAEKFQAACAANGTTGNAVLKAAVEKYVEDYEKTRGNKNGRSRNNADNRSVD